jgi:membrane protease YdiL (CAAX protease family)
MLLFLIVTQFIPGFVIVIVAIVVRALGSPNPGAGLDSIFGPEGMKELERSTLLPSLAASVIIGALFGILVIRLVVGKDWKRQLAVRLPSWTHLGFVLLGFPSLPLLAQGGYLLAQRFIPGLDQLLSLIAAQLAVMLFISFTWLLGRISDGLDWKHALAHSSLRQQLCTAIPGILGAVVLVGGVYWVIHDVVPSLPMLAELNKSMEMLVEESRSWPLGLAILVIGVGPGISEELWCRGLYGRGLIGQYGVILGIFLASYFFGAMHVLPHQGTMALLMGLALHFSYVVTRSLFVPMLLHFLNNSLSVSAHVIEKHLEAIDTAPDQLSPLLYVGAGLLMLGVGIALYRTRARLVRSDGMDLPAWQPPYPSVALPPADSGTIVTHPWPDLLSIAATLVGLGSFGVIFALWTMDRLPTWP